MEEISGECNDRVAANAKAAAKSKAPVIAVVLRDKLGEVKLRPHKRASAVWTKGKAKVVCALKDSFVCCAIDECAKRDAICRNAEKREVVVDAVSSETRLDIAGLAADVSKGLE